MAKFKILLLAFVTFFISYGCQSSKGKELSSWMEENGKLKILSTTKQIGDLVAFIGKDRIEGIILIEGDLNPHTYELVKGDGEKVKRADLIFYNGLGLEHGASLSSLLKQSPKALAIGESIGSRYPDRVLLKDGVIDPHIWMDISLWKEGIDPIAERLSAADPVNGPYYLQRAKILKEELDLVHQEIADSLKKIPKEKRYLVTSHDAFGYFTRSYLAERGDSSWQERFAAPEGLAPDGQLNPIDLQEIIDHLKKHEIRVIFPESNVSRDSIHKILTAAKGMGFEVMICDEALYGDSTGDLNYLDSMRQNARVILENLRL